MGKTSSHFKSLGKEPVSRQLLKFFERNSAKNVPNSLITLVGMSSDFEAFFVFNFLIIKATLPVLTFWKVKVLLYFFHFLFNRYFAWMSLNFCDGVINIIIIYIIIILLKRSDTEACNNQYSQNIHQKFEQVFHHQ